MTRDDEGIAMFVQSVVPDTRKNRLRTEIEHKCYTTSITDSGPTDLGASGTDGLRAEVESQEGSGTQRAASSIGVYSSLDELVPSGEYG